MPIPAGGFKRLGELRDRTSPRWSAECLTPLDPEVLTPIIEGRWLDGYDVVEVLPRTHCPVLRLQADPTAGGALTDDHAQLALRSIADGRCVRFYATGHQLHRDRPEAVPRAVQEFTVPLSLTTPTTDSQASP